MEAPWFILRLFASRWAATGFVDTGLSFLSFDLPPLDVPVPS